MTQRDAYQYVLKIQVDIQFHLQKLAHGQYYSQSELGSSKGR